jgi:hypothetical protein
VAWVWEPPSVLVGGKGTLTVEVGDSYTHPETGWTASPGGIVLDGPHENTAIAGHVNGIDVKNCDYAGESYRCDLLLPANLIVENSLTYGDKGNLTTHADLRGWGHQPMWFDFRNLPVTESVGTHHVGGTLTNPQGIHACVAIYGDLISRPGSPHITISADCENTDSEGAQGLMECNQGVDGMLLDLWTITAEASVKAADTYQHMVSRVLNCGIDTEIDVDHVVTVSGPTPVAAAPSVSGTILSGTNGGGLGLPPPTVTVQPPPVGVAVGDRFVFTSGVYSGEERIVLAIAGNVLHLSGPGLVFSDGDPGAPIPGVVNVGFTISRPLCLAAGPGGFGGWVACSQHGGPESVKIAQTGDIPEFATQGSVEVLQGVAQDLSCNLTWVRNGLDQAGFEYYPHERPPGNRGEDASWNLGGGVSANLFAPLRAAGDFERRVLTQGLDPGPPGGAGDYLELQLTPGSSSACALGPCGCFGGKDLGVARVEITTFEENIVP